MTATGLSAIRSASSGLLLFFAASMALSQTTGTPLSMPADSPRWDRQGKVQASEFQGRACLSLDGGAAVVKDFDMRDGIVDVDVATPAVRGFFGIQFRVANDGADAEWVYLRQTTPDAPWQRHPPAMPEGTLTRWSLSPAYDALARNLERPLTRAELGAIRWDEVQAEPPGFVVINRYRDSPHPNVSFQGDFSKRLEPQPGMKVVYARTRVDARRDQVKKLYIGYSDDVSVFLNGKILYRGRSAQGFRDPGFLGIVNAENDALYLPLKKGRNELVLAVSELGGGWGFVCRWADQPE